MLAVLAADLLYLYAAGAWYDPNQLIEVAELAALALFVVLGIGTSIYNLWRLQ